MAKQTDLINVTDPPLVVARGTFVFIHVDMPQPGEILRPGTTLSGSGWVMLILEYSEAYAIRPLLPRYMNPRLAEDVAPS